MIHAMAHISLKVLSVVAAQIKTIQNGLNARRPSLENLKGSEDQGVPSCLCPRPVGCLPSGVPKRDGWFPYNASVQLDCRLQARVAR